MHRCNECGRDSVPLIQFSGRDDWLCEHCSQWEARQGKEQFLPDEIVNGILKSELTVLAFLTFVAVLIVLALYDLEIP